MSKVLQGLLLIIIIAGVAYGSIVVYANCVAFKDTGAPGTPSIAKADHSFRIMNTGNTLMASEYEQQGNAVGSRIYTLHGFWELVGNDYKYRRGDIILDEKIFGEIRVTERR